MRDVDATRIQRLPVVSTVAALAAIPIPEIRYPAARRIAPQELTIYRIRAIIDRIRVEDDGDWHLVLKDPEDLSASMIVEIPDPACVDDIELKETLSEARRALHAVPKRGMAEFEGVGFFDFIHSQQGVARNGFELHPVLVIRPLNSHQ